VSRSNRHTRNCDYCGKEYTGYGDKYCGLQCLAEAKKDRAHSRKLNPHDPNSPTIDTFPIPEHHAPERIWEKAEAETESAIKYHSHRHTATITFPTALPILVSGVADQHLSETAPMFLRRAREDAELISATEGAYAVLGGDGVDNHIKHATAMIASGSKPGNEYRMYDHYLGILEGSVAAMVSGNHDDWTKDLTDVDQVGRLAAKRNLFFAPDFVILTFRFETGQEYIWKVRHQYRFNSSDNASHSVKKMWAMDDDDFDVGMVCHKHEAAMEPFRKHGLIRIAMRPGSYQFTSGFSRRYGYVPSIPTCPSVIFLPNTRKMIGFWDVREAASYLTWLRDGWPNTGEILVA